MSTENIRLDRDGAVVTVTIDRARALNALDGRTLDEIAGAVAALAADASARAVVITGGGEKAFVAGADIAAMESMSAVEAREFSARGQAVFHSLEALAVPVIAAVNGFALGGGLELALACDMIFASDTARFGQPEINLGIVPGFGGTQRLPRRVGIARAREMIYSGDMIDAAEALRIGLVNRVYPAAELLARSVEFAAALGAKAPIALRLAKAAIASGVDLDLANACRYESEVFAVSFSSDDRREGMAAFLAKRKANFTGR